MTDISKPDLRPWHTGCKGRNHWLGTSTFTQNENITFYFFALEVDFFFFKTSPPWTNASSNHSGCADRTSRLPWQQHSQHRLTGSLSGSLSAERRLTNETQIIKTRTLKRKYGQVPPICWAAEALLSSWLTRAKRKKSWLSDHICSTPPPTLYPKCFICCECLLGSFIGNTFWRILWIV